MELETYLEALASDTPTPGGGSAAALVGAFAAALVAMVGRITRKNPAFAERSEELEKLVSHADRLRAEFVAARGDDETAYGRVVAAMALPKTDVRERAERTAALQEALAGAARAPLHVARIALATLRLSDDVGAFGNANLASDVTAAAAFARAALRTAAANVRANHAYLRDAELVRAQEDELVGVETAGGVRDLSDEPTEGRTRPSTRSG